MNTRSMNPEKIIESTARWHRERLGGTGDMVGERLADTGDVNGYKLVKAFLSDMDIAIETLEEKHLRSIYTN